MTFKIYGCGLSSINPSDKKNAINLPDIDTLIAAYDKAINGKTSNADEKPVEKKPIWEKSLNPYAIQSILANHKKNAFTVVWADGTYTVIHLQPGDKWDDEKALAMCFVKKMMGNKGSFNDIFTQELPSKLKEITKKEESKNDTPKDGTMATGSIDDFSIEKKPIEKTKETINKMGEAAEKTNAAMKKMINEFVGEPVKVQRYDLFLMDPCGDKTEIYHQGTDEEIHKAMRAYRMKHYPTLERNKTPYRVWMNKGNLIVDFGAGSYFTVPGMDHDTFLKSK